MLHLQAHWQLVRPQHMLQQQGLPQLQRGQRLVLLVPHLLQHMHHRLPQLQWAQGKQRLWSRSKRIPKITQVHDSFGCNTCKRLLLQVWSRLPGGLCSSGGLHSSHSSSNLLWLLQGATAAA